MELSTTAPPKLVILGTSLPSEAPTFHQPPRPHGSATEKAPEPVSSIPPPFSLCTPKSYPFPLPETSKNTHRSCSKPFRGHPPPSVPRPRAQPAREALTGGSSSSLATGPALPAAFGHGRGLGPQGVCSRCLPAWGPSSVPKSQPQCHSPEAFLDASQFTALSEARA